MIDNMERIFIEEKLSKIFHDVFIDSTIVIREEMSAEDIENWDSLTHMLMISEVEKEFGIKIKLRELNKLNTVGNLIDLIESKTA